MSANQEDPDAITPAPPKDGPVQTVSAVLETPAASSSSGSRPISSTETTAVPAQLPSMANSHNQFLLLPHEIMSLVFHFSDWPTARALRQTCRHMRVSFTVLTTIRKVRAHRAALLTSDNGTFPAPCYRCVRILPKESFPSMPEYQRAMGHMYSRDFEWRRCTECLMCGNKMPVGVPYTWRGKKLVHCSFCNRHRPWIGRMSATSPAQYCGRCRDVRYIGGRCKMVMKSLHFWVALMGFLMAVFSAMSWRTIARIWASGHPYDHSVLAWAFFSACHTLVVQIIYWILILISFATRSNSHRRPHRLVTKLLDSNFTVLETTLEWIAIVVSMCMPFLVHEIASVPLLGWSTLSWAAAGVATLLRLCDD